MQTFMEAFFFIPGLHNLSPINQSICNICNSTATMDLIDNRASLIIRPGFILEPLWIKKKLVDENGGKRLRLQA